MGYSADAPIRSLVPDDLPERVAAEVARRVGGEMEERVRERTPVAELPEAYQGNVARWVKDRKGRRPGTLRNSWKQTPVRARGASASVSVFTDDPVAPHVEWNTRPHLIRARKPGGVLRFPSGPSFLYRKQVHHPGTTGVHMMRDTMAEVETRWPAVAEEVLLEVIEAEERGL